jgi:hypothetical protein
MAALPQGAGMMDASLPAPTLTGGLILNRTLDLLRLNGLRAAFAMALLTSLGISMDLGWVTNAGAGFLINAAALGLQFWVTAAVLESLGLRISSGPRFPAFFLLGIVTSLGILLGVVLLVLPGIFLFVRWSIATPAVIATNDRLSDAMSYSWRETEPNSWPILLAFVVIYGAAAAGVAVGFLLEQQTTPYGTILLEVSLNGGLIAGWHAGVAIYAETQHKSRYSEVFA